MPLTCIKSFVTNPEQSKYSHLPTLLSFTNVIEGKRLGHPRKEGMETQTQQEKRPGPRARRQSAGTDSEVWTNRQRAEEEERGMGERRADKGKHTKRWTGKGTVAGDRPTADK